MRLFRTPGGIAALAGAALVAGLFSARVGAAVPADRSAQLRHACAPAHDRTATCFAVSRGPAGRSGADPSTADGPSGLTPTQIADAYKLPVDRGVGKTVAIVDAYDDPHAESDLAVFRKQFGLPACTTANGCFRKVNQRGIAKPLPRPDSGWSQEIALDVQAVSAACPQCHILLVEGDSAQIEDLGAGVNTAVRLRATVVSNSYGAAEYHGASAVQKRYFRHPGVPIVASTGDDGFGPANIPAVFPVSIAVGGTRLKRAPGTARGWTESAWNGAGSGCSAYFAKPSWQHDPGCSMRAIADVSAVADPDTGLSVYDTYGEGDDGWTMIGGTSLAAPLISGMIALAGNSAVLSSAAYLYAHRTRFNDVVGGSNNTYQQGCGRAYLCTGLRGYDGPSGLGTPMGLGAL